MVGEVREPSERLVERRRRGVGDRPVHGAVDSSELVESNRGGGAARGWSRFEAMGEPFLGRCRRGGLPHTAHTGHVLMLMGGRLWSRPVGWRRSAIEHAGVAEDNTPELACRRSPADRARLDSL